MGLSTQISPEDVIGSEIAFSSRLYCASESVVCTIVFRSALLGAAFLKGVWGRIKCKRTGKGSDGINGTAGASLGKQLVLLTVDLQQ